MRDPNALVKSSVAINVLESAGVVTKRQATGLRKKLLSNLNEEIGYWGEKNADDFVDALNAAYVAASR